MLKPAEHSSGSPERGVPDAAPGRGSSHLLPCAHAARPAASADLTWALGQASASAAISTLFVPLPKPLQPSDPGFPLGKSPPCAHSQPCLLLSPRELLRSAYLQKLHSVPCKPTLTFSSKSFSRSWMMIQPFPACAGRRQLPWRTAVLTRRRQAAHGGRTLG